MSPISCLHSLPKTQIITYNQLPRLFLHTLDIRHFILFGLFRKCRCGILQQELFQVGALLNGVQFRGLDNFSDFLIALHWRHGSCFETQRCYSRFDILASSSLSYIIFGFGLASFCTLPRYF